MAVAEVQIVDGLRTRYKQGEGWRELFDMLATYSNRTSSTTAESAARSAGLAQATVVRLLKELAALGIGDFKHGRHQFKTRIEWAYSPGSVGQVAQGKRTQLDAYDAAEPDDAADSSDAASEESLNLGDLLQAAKDELAERLGIDAERIEITIRA